MPLNLRVIDMSDSEPAHLSEPEAIEYLKSEPLLEDFDQVSEFVSNIAAPVFSQVSDTLVQEHVIDRLTAVQPEVVILAARQALKTNEEHGFHVYVVLEKLTEWAIPNILGNFLSGIQDESYAKSVINALLSFPDFCAKSRTKYDYFLLTPYAKKITESLLRSLRLTPGRLRKNISCDLRGHALLLSKLASMGCFDKIARSVVQQLQTFCDQDIIYSRISNKLFAGIQAAQLEHVIGYTVLEVSSSRHLNLLVGSLPLSNSRAKYIFTILLTSKYFDDEKVPRKILEYFDKLDQALFIETTKSVLATWADPCFLRTAPLQHVKYLSATMMVGLGLMETPVDGSAMTGILMEGMHAYLNSQEPDVRLSGMVVAEALTDKCCPIPNNDKEPTKLKFDYEETPYTTWLKTLLESNTENSSTELAKAAKIRKFDENSDSDLDRRMENCCRVQATETPGNDTPVSKDAATLLDSDDDEFEPYEIPQLKSKKPVYILDCFEQLGEDRDWTKFDLALGTMEGLIRRNVPGFLSISVQIARSLLHLENKFNTENFYELRMGSLVACAVMDTKSVVPYLTGRFYEREFTLRQRLDILECLLKSAEELAHGTIISNKIDRILGKIDLISRKIDPLPTPGHDAYWKATVEAHIAKNTKRKTRKQVEIRENKLAKCVDLFFYPLLSKYDLKMPHLDLLGRDHVLLGRTIFATAQTLSFASHSAGILQMCSLMFEIVLKLRFHPEPFVRQSVMFAICMMTVSVSPAILLTEFSDVICEIKDWLEALDTEPLAAYAYTLLGNAVREWLSQEGPSGPLVQVLD